MHTTSNRLRVAKQERQDEIDLENGLLLQKVGPNHLTPTDASLALQMTKILHARKPALPKPSSSCSRNHRIAFQRQSVREKARVEAENLALLTRLRSRKPNYSTSKLLSDFSKSRECVGAS